jgi:Carboxypeptidase regulatory-like domain
MRASRFLLMVIAGSSLVLAAGQDLAGRVVDANTREPISHARVAVRSFTGPSPPPEVTLLSGADGSFQVTNLPEVGYLVVCTKAGFLSYSKFFQPTHSADKGVATILVEMTAQAAVEGTVVDDKDTPIENAFIQLVRQAVVSGRREYQAVGGGVSDETGYFRIFGVVAGHYYISIQARINGTLRAKSQAYPQVFYPNSTELAAAQPFDLKAGDEPHIKVKLPEPVPAWEIRGTMATSNPNVNVMFTLQNPNRRFLAPNVDTNWDAKTRTFRISRVTPGTYVLIAVVQESDHRLEASTTVTVGDSDVTGIRLQPAEYGIDGIVHVEGAATRTQNLAIGALSPDRNMAGQVDADGKFHIPGLAPDTYRIVPRINPQDGCIGSILRGGRDVRDALTISAEAASEPLEVTITSHCGGISGTVALPDAGLPPNLMAVLLRKAGDELVLERQFHMGERSPGAARTFAMDGITPGDYMVYLWPEDAQIEYSNAEYMRQFESYGQAVTITEGNRTSVTLDKILTVPAKN